MNKEQQELNKRLRRIEELLASNTIAIGVLHDVMVSGRTEMSQEQFAKILVENIKIAKAMIGLHDDTKILT